MPAILTSDSTPDVVLDWLHENGWSMSHGIVHGIWTVSGTRGNQHIKAEGRSLEEAWLLATELACNNHVVPLTSKQ
ncbi:MAG TPA: hypothetical protein PLN21_06430 [Gemmatales bacterium]|nr:hypothetical protein [Gemmatales bacterium]